jgi:N4-gp56 family major capsid protein
LIDPIECEHTVIRNFQNAVVVQVPIARAFGNSGKVSYEETSFSIDKSCQVGQVYGSNFTQIILFKFRHIFSFVKYSSIINESCIYFQPERLSEKTAHKQVRKSELGSNVERVIRRGCSAMKMVKKVTEMVLNEATKVLSLQLGLTLDTLIRDMLVSTSSSISCQFGSNGNTPTEITDLDIQTAVIALRQGNARLMTNPLPGENKFGTAPVRSSYWGFMSVDLQADLEAVSSFISSANYPNPMNALEAEWGSTRNVRWLMNTNGYSTSDAIPVYSSFLVGQEAYGVVRLGAKEAEFIVKPLGASGTADPLNQRGTVGYKYPFATRILNDNWVTQLLSTI